MKNHAKRFLSLFCALALCLSLLPMSALATDTETSAEQTEVEITQTPEESTDTPTPEPSVEPSVEPSLEPSEEPEPTDTPEPVTTPEAGNDITTQEENGEEPSGETTSENSDWTTDGDAKTVSIYTADGLRAWADSVRESNNRYDGYTISIEDDIDLSGGKWTSIISLGGTVTIDGKNHTISNMTISEKGNGSGGNTYLGFIGNLNYNTKLTVQDITFENAHVQDPNGDSEYSWCGVVVGHGPMDGVKESQAECTFTNVAIINSVVTGGHNNGAIMGYSCSTERGILFDSCSVTDTFVGGYNSTSGILFGMGIANVTVRNCTADGVRLYTDGLNFNCSQSWDDQLWLGNVYPYEIYGDRYGSNGTATYEGTNDAGDSCVVYPVFFHVYNSQNQEETIKKYVPVNTDLSEFDSWFADYPDSSPTWYSDEACTEVVTQIVADLTDDDMYPYGTQASVNDKSYETQNTDKVDNPLTHGAINLYQKKIVTPAWETSKSKTATNLDSNYKSDVTLSLPAADYKPVIDVVFVIDDTSAHSTIFVDAATALLDELRSKENLDVNFGLVTFDAVARDWLDVTSDGAISGLVSLSNDTNYEAICEAINTPFDSSGVEEEKRLGGTNTEWPMELAQELLAEGNGTEQHVIVFSDMYGYVYRGDLTVGDITYSDVPLSKRLGNYPQGQLCISPPMYDTWDGVYANYAKDDVDLDTFFRDSSWNDYWTIYTDEDSIPDIDNAPKTSAPQYDESGPYVYFTPFEKSSCLTYDRILGLLNEGIQVTIVNNDFNPDAPIGSDPGYDPAPDGIGKKIRSIKDEMLDALESEGVMVVQEVTSNGGTFTSTQMGTIFSKLENKLIQLVDAGSKVVDEIGSGSDYNFDFVNSAGSLILKVGGNQYATTAVTENLSAGETARYTFTYDGISATNGAEAPFVLHYYKNGTTLNGKTYGECFVWDINVPVTKDATVQLTYTVKLTKPQTASGTYGRYDADGSEGYSGLYTNNIATLYPIDSAGNKVVPEDFAKPTVSYTVQTTRPDPDPTPGGGHKPGGGNDKPEDLNTEDHVAYIIGYTDGTVRPEGYIARSEVATIFFRLLTDEARETYWSQTNPYSDVDSGDWYNNAISTLTNMGILDGYLDGTFRPTDPITRSEFTKIAVSFFDYADENFRYDGRFSDVEGNEWYVNFLAAAIEYGLIEGMPDGTFHPLDNITRAEACTIVNRTLGREPHEDHLLPRREMITWPDNSTTAWYYADMQEATNSHDYTWITINEDEDDEMEVEEWTEKLEERDWAALERAWSDAHDAPGGEVMD